MSPFCARRQKTTILSQPTRHQGGWLGGTRKELGVKQLQHPTSPLHLQHRHPSFRYASPETFLGAAKPSTHWCWAIRLIPAQLGNGSICGMRLWRWKSNSRACNSSLSPVLSTSWDNCIGTFGWWHNHLATWILPGHLKRSCSYEQTSKLVARGGAHRSGWAPGRHSPKIRCSSGEPLATLTLSTCPIYVGFKPTLMWACCCGLDIIITFLNYDIKNLIVNPQQQAHMNWTCGRWTG